MRRTALLLALAAALTASLAAPVLQAQDGAASAGQVPTRIAAQSPQAAAEPTAPDLDTLFSPAYAATCTPSPLCPGSACDADCKHRGARFGFCTAEQCCICFWKI